MDHDPRLALAVRTGMALMLFCLAGFLLALACGFFSPGAGTLRTPGWLVGIGGFVFAAGGVAVVFQHRPAVGWLAAMLILACGVVAGLWIGLFADPGDIGGGFPLLAASTNARLGRAAFVSGGLACFALLAWGLWLGPNRQRLD